MKTLTINGYTGHETRAELDAMYEAKLVEIRSTAKDQDEGVRMFDEWLYLHHSSLGCAKYHNAIAKPAARYVTLRRAATVRTGEATNTYAELADRHRTAWHAAHHRFVLASIAARTVLAELVEVANELHSASAADMSVSREMYEQMVAAEDRAVELPDLSALRAELDAFVETSRERFAVTAATTAGTVPAGFEPAPQPALQGDERQPNSSREDHAGW